MSLVTLRKLFFRSCVVVHFCREVHSLCPVHHVELEDGRCERSWDSKRNRAVKPPKAAMRKLCKLTTHDLELLQSWYENVPANLWREPAAKFSDGEVLDYMQINVHFVKVRSDEYGEYWKYPIAKEVHPWIEQILQRITSRYNYSSDVPLPQGAGLIETSIPRLMLARLGPKSQQMQHSDTGGSSRVPHKIHVPITSTTGASLVTYYREQDGYRSDYYGEKQVQRIEHEMEVGYAYEVNNLFPHFAQNRGLTYRTHLLFEYLPVDVHSEWSADDAPLTQTEFQKRKNAFKRQGLSEDEARRSAYTKRQEL